MIAATKRVAMWFVGLAVLGASAIVIWLSPDPWRWGVVAAVSFAILCEVWHGYCQHSRSVADLHRGQRNVSQKVPRPDSFFARDVVAMRESQRHEDGSVEMVDSGVVTIPKVSDRAVVHSSVIRAAGRLTLAAFVIAGFAAHEFEIPWFTGA